MSSTPDNLNKNIASKLLEDTLQELVIAAYVVDVDTKVILFSNRQLREAFGWEADMQGKRLCDVSFPAFYSALELLGDIDALWAMEEGSFVVNAFDAETDTYYRIRAKKVEGAHEGHAIVFTLADTTHFVCSEKVMQKQLERNRMISDISQGLVTEEDPNVALNRAMKLIGEFLHMHRIFVSKFDPGYNSMEFVYCWECEGWTGLSIFNIPSVEPGGYYVDRIRENEGAEYIVEDVQSVLDQTGGLQVAWEFGIKSIVSYPITIGGRLWGTLEFNACEEIHKWSEEDIELGRYLRSVISAALNRLVIEPELQEKNKIIKTIMDNVPSAVFWKDMNSVFLGCNKYFERFIGYSNEEIVNRHENEFLPKNYNIKTTEYEEYLLKSPTGRVSYTMKFRDCRGDFVYFQVKKVVIYDEKGNAIYIVGVYENVGDYYVLESVRNPKSGPNVLSLVDVINTPSFIIRTDGSFDLQKSGKFLFAGYGQDELKNTIAEYFLPSDKQALRKILDAIAAGPTQSHNYTGRVTDKSGQVLDYALEFYPLYDDTGVLSGVNVSYLDVTEQKEAARQIKRMTKIIQNTPLVISIYDAETKARFYNPAIESVSGYTVAEAEAGSFPLLYDPKTVEMIENNLQSVTPDKPANVQATMIRKDGQRRTISYSGFLIDKTRREVASIGMDITESIKMQNALVEAKKQAEEASRAKGEFLSRMSHEIRTPLNAIIGMTDIGRASISEEKRQYCFDQITNASNHLLGIINDILDLSKIEADKFEISAHEFDLEKMLMSVANVINFRAEEKEQTFLVTIDKNIPNNVVSDELRLSQVITNLLSNAVKFTPEKGLIMLGVSCLSHDENRYTLQFEVADNGIGISPEDQQKLFRSFEQADGGIARRFGGTGLGLSISKRIIELMGGSIWVESKAGEGSKFIFRIEVERGRMSPQPQLHPNIDRDKLRILVADDSEEIRNYFVKLMEALHLPCDVARDGFEALEMYADSLNLQPYNIVFIDWQMPKLDGIELGRRIKQISKDNIVIMISVANREDLEERALRAGIDRVLTKPVFPSMLINVVNESLGLAPMTQEKKEETLTYDFTGRCLLLAEDVKINQEIVKTYLEETHIQIDCAENGVEALHLYRSSPQKYDVILMDIHMPDMDGYDATRRIRQLDFPSAKAVPIIAMTANVFQEDIDRCLETGMDDHIGKPVKLTDLLSKLAQYLNRGKEAQAPLSIEELHDAEAGDLAESADISRYLDLETGLEMAANNKAIYLKLLRDFDGRDSMEKLCGDLAGVDYQSTEQSAHAIKGIAANLAFPELQKIAFEIEQLSKAGQPAGHLLQPLKKAYDNVTRAKESLLKSEGML